MRVLITGGLGYLGCRLASQLKNEGCEVFLGTRDGIKFLKEPLAYSVPVQMDWKNQMSLESATIGMDTVIHAAGMNAQKCFAYPTRALEVNGLNTARILEASIEKKVKRFIYISTVHVYSSTLSGKIDETTPSTNLNPYATSKLAGEKLVLNAMQMEKIQGIVLRISNGSGHPVFPETQCWHLILNNLCRQAIETKKMILNSKNSIEKNFISMKNVCLGIRHFLNLSKHQLDCLPFNLCSKKSHSLQQLAEIILSRCEKKLGFSPDLNSLNNDRQSKFKRELYLSSKKTENTGLFMKENLVQEIDETLLYCARHFSGVI